MIGGFAILAYSAEYRNSGVMTLIINRDYIVFQKDLGEKTADIAKTINECNPDDSWNPVDDTRVTLRNVGVAPTFRASPMSTTSLLRLCTVRFTDA
jgi:hypothetical protein